MNTGCWECHQFGSLVCLGPHPDYDHDRAKASGHVIPDPNRGMWGTGPASVESDEVMPPRRWRIHGSLDEALARLRGEHPQARPPEFRRERVNELLRQIWMEEERGTRREGDAVRERRHRDCDI